MLTPLTNIKIWHDQVSQAMIYDVVLYRVRFTLNINLEASTAVIDIQIFEHRFLDTFDIILCHIHVFTELCSRVHTTWRYIIED